MCVCVPASWHWLLLSRRVPCSLPFLLSLSLLSSALLTLTHTHYQEEGSAACALPSPTYTHACTAAQVTLLSLPLLQSHVPLSSSLSPDAASVSQKARREGDKKRERERTTAAAASAATTAAAGAVTGVSRHRATLSLARAYATSAALASFFLPFFAVLLSLTVCLHVSLQLSLSAHPATLSPSLHAPILLLLLLWCWFLALYLHSFSFTRRDTGCCHATSHMMHGHSRREQATAGASDLE